jgi:hypothetical protein
VTSAPPPLTELWAADALYPVMLDAHGRIEYGGAQKVMDIWDTTHPRLVPYPKNANVNQRWVRHETPQGTLLKSTACPDRYLSWTRYTDESVPALVEQRDATPFGTVSIDELLQWFTDTGIREDGLYPLEILEQWDDDTPPRRVLYLEKSVGSVRLVVGPRKFGAFWSKYNTMTDKRWIACGSYGPYGQHGVCWGDRCTKLRVGEETRLLTLMKESAQYGSENTFQVGRMEYYLEPFGGVSGHFRQVRRKAVGTQATVERILLYHVHDRVAALRFIRKVEGTDLRLVRDESILESITQFVRIMRAKLPETLYTVTGFGQDTIWHRAFAVSPAEIEALAMKYDHGDGTIGRTIALPRHV